MPTKPIDPNCVVNGQPFECIANQLNNEIDNLQNQITIISGNTGGGSSGTTYVYYTETTGVKRSGDITVWNDADTIKSQVRAAENGCFVSSGGEVIGTNLSITTKNDTDGRISLVTVDNADDGASIVIDQTAGSNPYVIMKTVETAPGEYGTILIQAPTQKLGFFTETVGDAVVQQTTSITGATRVGGGGAALTDTDTFDGYTVGQVVAALKAYGLLA